MADDPLAEFDALGGSGSDNDNPLADFDALGTESSAMGSFARGAAEGAAPAIGGVLTGMGVGGALGSVAGPIGTVAGGVAGGIAGGVAISKAQQWLLDKLGWRDEAQEAADEAQHPWARAAGEMAPAALTLHPSGSMMQRAIGAGIGAVGSAAGDLVENGKVTPSSVLMGAGMGAAFPSPNRLGQKFERLGAAAGARIRGQPAPAEAPTTPGGPPENPEPLTDVEEDAGQSSPIENPALQFARQQVADMPDDHPLRYYWDQHIASLEAQERGLASPDDDNDARYGPGGQDNQFLPPDADKANDITTVARGIAAENPKAPEIEGAGNPTGAPMVARKAQRPSGPQRDYRKQAVKPAQQSGESAALTTDAVRPDVARALAVDEPTSGMDQQTVRTPVEQQPVETGLAPQPQQPLAEPQPVAPAPQPEPQPQPVETGLTAAVTDPTVNSVRQRLKTLGMNDVLQKFESFDPEKQAAEAPKVLDAIKNIRNARKTEGGVGYRDEADRARKEGSTAAVKDAVEGLPEEHGLTLEHTPENKQAIIEHATALHDAAKEAFGGKDPVKAPEGYYPTPATRTPEHTLVYKARAVALSKKPKWPQLEDYVHALELRGQSGTEVDAGIQRSGRSGNRENDAEIAHEPREPFEPFTNVTGDESQQYTEGQNQLREWLNGLSDEDYERLASRNDIKTDVYNTQDPGAVLDAYTADLAQANPRRAAAPKGRSTPVRSAEDLARFGPTEAGAAASEARSLDKNSPEYKAMAEAALQSKAGQAPVAKKGSKAEAANKTLYNSTWDAATKAMVDFASNEQGGAKIPQAVLDWFEPRPYDPSSQHRSEQVEKVLDYMPGWFKQYANQRGWDKGQLVGNSVKAQAQGLSKDEWKDIHLAVQQQKEKALSGKLFDAWRETGKPLLDKGNALYQEIYNRRGEDQRLADLPAPHPGYENRYFPREKLGDPNTDPENVNPVIGNTFSLHSPNLLPREFTALLDNNTGDRMVLRTDPETGKFSIWQNLKMRPLSKVPSAFTGQVGDVLPLYKNGKLSTYVVDHATTDEITKHNGTEYQQNPVVLASNWVNQLQAVKANLDIVKKIKEDPLFINNTTVDRDEAIKRGYDMEQTKLPPLQERQGKQVYMPKNMKWMFDDAYRQGFGGRTADWWRQTGSGLARIFMTFGSPIHVGNVGTNAIIARGFDNVTPKGLRALGITGVRAFKAMMDPANSQDLHDFMKAGGRPQFLSTTTNDLGNKIARNLGADIAKQPAKWDPIARIWGVSTGDLARSVENFSTSNMWRLSDMFAIQRFLENRDFKGMTPEAAAEDVHKFIPAYDLPSTVGGRGEISRFASQALADPAVSLFGRYHMDLLRSFAHVTRSVLGPSSTPQERLKGVGQMLTAGALAYVVYPALDKLVQMSSGNPDGEMGRRGMLAITDAAQKLAQGQSDYQRLASNLFTPSIPLNMATRVLGNATWNRKNIVQQQKLNPAGLARAAGEAGEWTAQNTIAPYGNVATALEKPGATPLSAAGHFAAGMVGAHIPSAAERKYKAQQPKINLQQIRAREKRPTGPIERVGNYIAQSFAAGGQVQPQGGGKSPQLSPDHITAAVTRGTQIAMRRPIVTTRMPSGANSSTNLNGPVFVDPRVPMHLRRPVAVHETVEQILMSMGMPYPQAHIIATKAEKAALLRMGGNWERYEAQWRGILDETERERVSASQTPPGLHVNPMAAIGKSGGGHAVQEARA